MYIYIYIYRWFILLDPICMPLTFQFSHGDPIKTAGENSAFLSKINKMRGTSPISSQQFSRASLGLTPFTMTIALNFTLAMSACQDCNLEWSPVHAWHSVIGGPLHFGPSPKNCSIDLRSALANWLI